MGAIKICSKCGQSKPLTEFGRDAKTKDGVRAACKVCKNQSQNSARDGNREKFRSQSRQYDSARRGTPKYQEYLESSRERRRDLKTKYRRQAWVLPHWMKANRDQHVKDYQAWLKQQEVERTARAWKFFNGLGMKLCRKCGLLHGLSDFYKDKSEPDGLMSTCKSCDNNRVITNRNSSPINKLKHRMRNLIALSLKNQGYSKRSRTHQILGCDFDFFVKHIERQFTKGMTWNRVGKEIHIDHITPLATAKTEDDVIALNHFTNLRPCWAKENLSKSAKIEFII